MKLEEEPVRKRQGRTTGQWQGIDTIPILEFEETEALNFSGNSDTWTRVVKSPTTRRRMPN